MWSHCCIAITPRSTQLKCPGYDTKLHPIVRLQFWRVWRHCYIVVTPRSTQVRYHFLSHVWFNLGLNFGLLDHWQRFYSIGQWYLVQPCLTLNIIKYGSGVKWSNPRNGVVHSPTPQCSSYWEGILWVTFNKAANRDHITPFKLSALRILEITTKYEVFKKHNMNKLYIKYLFYCADCLVLLCWFVLFCWLVLWYFKPCQSQSNNYSLLLNKAQ